MEPISTDGRCSRAAGPSRESLYRAFAEFDAGDARITGAGRTDAGVHAAGQVASVKIDIGLGTGVLLRALNAKLPRDIAVRSVEEVPLSFSARFDALSRTYSYIFILKRTALWNRYYYPVRGGLDTDAMRRSLRALEGEHDFSSFANAGDDAGTICRMIRTGVERSDPLVTISVTADHFLYKMVRNIAGTVLRVGTGREGRHRGGCSRRKTGRRPGRPCPRTASTSLKPTTERRFRGGCGAMSALCPFLSLCAGRSPFHRRLEPVPPPIPSGGPLNSESLFLWRIRLAGGTDICIISASFKDRRTILVAR